MLWTRDQQTFSVKGQELDVLGFASHTVSVITVQLCCDRAKAVTDDMQINKPASVPMKLFIKLLFTGLVHRPYLLIPVLGTGDTVVKKTISLLSKNLHSDVSSTLKSESLQMGICDLE